MSDWPTCPPTPRRSMSTCPASVTTPSNHRSSNTSATEWSPSTCQLPVGTYAVAMRTEGAPETAAPVLTTQVTVQEGAAYTRGRCRQVRRPGPQGCSPTIWPCPAAGKAKVRIIQASVTMPVLDVSLASGTSIAKDVAFASTTPYQLVSQGSWTLALHGTGSSAVTKLS